MENVEGLPIPVATPPTNKPRSRFPLLGTISRIPGIIIGELFKPNPDHVILPESTLGRSNAFPKGWFESEHPKPSQPTQELP